MLNSVTLAAYQRSPTGQWDYSQYNGSGSSPDRPITLGEINQIIGIELINS